MSSNTDYYLNKVKELESNPVAAYQSQYGTQMSALMDKITNRQPFSYDFNADPLYQSYKDQYTKLGKEASMNAVANASALTGGYGNSYATTAGAQANQQYLTQLNNIIPELYDAALSKYNAEGDDLQNQYDNLRNLENDAYSKYQQDLDQYNTALNYYQNAYADQMANDQWAAEQGAANAQWQKEYELKLAQLAAKSDTTTTDTTTTKTGNAKTVLTPASPETTTIPKLTEAERFAILRQYPVTQTNTSATDDEKTAYSNYLAEQVNSGQMTRKVANALMQKRFG